jgi:prevent-host-death family protein
MRSIGIRELRQNASQYIRLVKAGETIEVTERGVPVAELRPCQPSPRGESPYEQLVREGKIRKGTQDWTSFKPIPVRPGERTLSEILQEMRDEDDR